MTTAQVVETSVTVNNNSPIQDYVHPDDQTQPTFDILPWCVMFINLYRPGILIKCRNCKSEKIRSSFITGDTRNTKSTIPLHWLAQLVGETTFGILKSLKRSFYLCLDIHKNLGRFNPCFPKLRCVGRRYHINQSYKSVL